MLWKLQITRSTSFIHALYRVGNCNKEIVIKACNRLQHQQLVQKFHLQTTFYSLQ